MTYLNLRMGTVAAFTVDGYDTKAIPIASDGRAIALVHAAFGDGEEIARLFVAAPGMLAALENMVRATRDRWRSLPADSFEKQSLEAARDIIAKAKGDA